MIFRFASDFKKKVIFTSTSEIYGKSSKVPFAEDDDSHFGPTSVDRWVYAYSKALGEYISFGYWKEGMPSSTIRIFNAYGPRLDVEGSGRVLSRFIKQLINDEPITIVGDGTQTRCFTYIDDIIKGLVLAGENEKALGNVFNIGNPVEIDIRKLADMLIDISGKKAKVVHIDPKSLYGQGYEDIPRRAPDVRKAKRVLGYEATTPLRDGMERTYKWFLAETNGGRA
jgi:UDP-glucose 4-epimerase